MRYEWWQQPINASHYNSHWNSFWKWFSLKWFIVNIRFIAIPLENVSMRVKLLLCTATDMSRYACQWPLFFLVKLRVHCSWNTIFEMNFIHHQCHYFRNCPKNTVSPMTTIILVPIITIIITTINCSDICTSRWSMYATANICWHFTSQSEGKTCYCFHCLQ